MLKIKAPNPVQELKTWTLWRDCMCELVGAFVLVFVNTVTGLVRYSATEPVSPVRNALAPGLTLVLLIECFGHISGAVFNPVVSSVFVCIGRISLWKGLLYCVFQVGGGAVSGAFLKAVSSEYMKNNTSPLGLNEGLSPGQGMLIEYVCTAVLLLAILGSTDAVNRVKIMPSLPIGFAVVTGVLWAGPLTGASMNPIIAIGPSLATGEWPQHWIYWAGPFLGGLTSLLLYEGFTYKRRSDDDVYHEVPKMDCE